MKKAILLVKYVKRRVKIVNMKYLFLLLVFVCIDINASDLTMEQKKDIILNNLKKDCKKYNLDCRLNPIYNYNLPPSTCDKYDTHCWKYDEKGNIIGEVCKKNDENC